MNPDAIKRANCLMARLGEIATLREQHKDVFRYELGIFTLKSFGSLTTSINGTHYREFLDIVTKDTLAELTKLGVDPLPVQERNRG